MAGNHRFKHIIIRHHKRKRARAMLRREVKCLQTPFISPEHSVPQELKNKYIDTLNFNALIHIIVHYRLSELALYDPQAAYATRLEGLMRHLKFLRVVTNRPEVYYEYNEQCLETIGCCAAVTDTLRLGTGDFVFAVEPLEQEIDDKEIFLLGAGGFTADIGSIYVPCADLLCPVGIKKEDFFTLLAQTSGYAPLLEAVPQQLEKDSNKISIEHLPLKPV